MMCSSSIVGTTVLGHKTSRGAVTLIKINKTNKIHNLTFYHKTQGVNGEGGGWCNHIFVPFL